MFIELSMFFFNRKVTALKDSSGPPPDLLLRFLLHSTTDIQPPCANCDNKTRVPMYYCNTCGKSIPVYFLIYLNEC